MLTIDFHAHILPKADHGSDSIETSLRQLELAQQAGVGVIVATPHYYPDRLDNIDFIEKRDKSAFELKSSYKGAIKIAVGAEVFLCEGLHNHPRLDSLCIENTKVILIEMPPPPWSKRYFNTVNELILNGYHILLAHIDRYPYRDILQLLQCGCKAQINTGAFSCIIMPHRLLELIDQGYVEAFGSDIHGVDKNKYREFSYELKKLGNRGFIIQSSSTELLKSLYN